MRLLKPGGLLCFVVTNKWMKAGYGEPLRRFFSEKAWVRSVVDFGHAKQIFEEVDVFPGILLIEKPSTDTNAPPESVRVCAIPREQLRIDDLSEQIVHEGFSIERRRLSARSWQIEPPGLLNLMAKIESKGKPLRVYSGKRPLFGVKTGFNEAYLIDSATRQTLIAADPACEAVIKPYLRGQDVRRWHPDWEGLWIILLKSSANETWPWSGKSASEAEKTFHDAFPSLCQRMKQFEERLRARSDKGAFWWELRSCGYCDVFDREKVIWQDIGYHSRFCLAGMGLVSEATCFALDTTDLWLLAVLNSPLIWCWLWRNTIHGKDEALRLKTLYTERIPIAPPAGPAAETAVRRLIDLTGRQQQTQRTLLDWLRVEYDIEKPSNKLLALTELDSSAWVSEVKRIRGKKQPLSSAGLHALRDEYTRTLAPARALAAETLALERTLSDLVNQAYALSPAEIALMWQTAPPRIPIAPPGPGHTQDQ